MSDIVSGAHKESQRSSPYEWGTVGYELAVNRLRAELNFLDETDAFAMMQYNMKVLAQLGPGDHWLLRKVDADLLKGGKHDRSVVASGTIDDILKGFNSSSSISTSGEVRKYEGRND